MTRNATVALVLALLVPGSTTARDVAIMLRPRGPAEIPEGSVLRLVCPTGDEDLVFDLGRDRRVSIPDEVRIVSCRVDGEALWSRSVEAVVTGRSATLVVDLWPASLVRGRIVEPKDLDGLAMRVSVTGAVDGAIQDLGTRQCTIGDDATFRCPVPGDRDLDLKIRLSGHVSRFSWARDTIKGIDLGPIPFQPGASVLGRVEVQGDCGPPEALIVVRLIPLASGWRPSEQDERVKRQAETAETGRRGFFHFDGVEAGSYRVVAERQGCAVARMSPVTVYPGTETTLRENLVVTSASELEVAVDPAVDPWGRPWTVRLDHITPLTGARDYLDERETSQAGVARFDGLSRGAFRVSVSDSGGSSWHKTTVDVATALERVEVFVDLVDVTGTVLLGDDPIDADLVFGGRHGIVSIKAFADRDGRFEVSLPREGEWKVDVSGTKVPAARTLREVDVFDGADLMLRLGDRSVGGRVVDDQGRPVAGTLVTVEIEDEPGNLSRTMSGEEGVFRLAGFDPGTVVLRAEDDALVSDEVVVDLNERSVDDVELVLKDRGRVSLHVVRSGRPVVGATALYLISRTAGLSMRRYTADLHGRIEIPVKSGDGRGSALVVAPGLPARLVPIDRGRSPVTVSLDGRGGSLSIRTTVYPFLRSDGAELPVAVFTTLSNLMAIDQKRNFVTVTPMVAGYYAACTGHSAAATCTGATLQEGVEITLD